MTKKTNKTKAKATAKNTKTKEVKISKALEDHSMPELLKLYNKHAPAKVKKFKDKPTAIRRIVSLYKEQGLTLPKRTSSGASGKTTKKTGGKREGTGKMQKIRDHFKSKKSATLDEIVKLSGFDSKNAQCAMSILKNKSRTKPEHLVMTEYDRKTKIYKRVD